MKLDIENAPELFRDLWLNQGYSQRTAPRAEDDMTLLTFTVDVCDDCQRLLTPRPFWRATPRSYRFFAYCDSCQKAAEL